MAKDNQKFNSTNTPAENVERKEDAGTPVEQPKEQPKEEPKQEATETAAKEPAKTKKLRNYGAQRIELALSDKLHVILPGQTVEVPAELEVSRSIKLEEVKD